MALARIYRPAKTAIWDELPLPMTRDEDACMTVRSQRAIAAPRGARSSRGPRACRRIRRRRHQRERERGEQPERRKRTPGSRGPTAPGQAHPLSDPPSLTTDPKAYVIRGLLRMPSLPLRGASCGWPQRRRPARPMTWIHLFDVPLHLRSHSLRKECRHAL